MAFSEEMEKSNLPITDILSAHLGTDRPSAAQILATSLLQILPTDNN
jgi:hypothetical protein